MTVQVHVWSDVVCPWCYLGKRRLDQALEEFGEDVELVYHSFELDPTRGGAYDREDPAEHLAQKYGMPTSRARQMMQEMATRGRAEGIDFALESTTTQGTFAAHRLLQFARAAEATDKGAQAALKERLMKAHFTENLDCTDPEVLANLAGDVGLDEDAARKVLATDAYADEVRADEKAAGDMGVRGVPFFLVGRYGFSGAQSAEVLLQALDRANLDEGAELETAETVEVPLTDFCSTPDC